MLNWLSKPWTVSEADEQAVALERLAGDFAARGVLQSGHVRGIQASAVAKPLAPPRHHTSDVASRPRRGRVGRRRSVLGESVARWCAGGTDRVSRSRRAVPRPS